jgi:hypothetical protein
VQPNYFQRGCQLSFQPDFHPMATVSLLLQ